MVHWEGLGPVSCSTSVTSLDSDWVPHCIDREPRDTLYHCQIFRAGLLVGSPLGAESPTPRRLGLKVSTQQYPYPPSIPALAWNPPGSIPPHPQRLLAWKVASSCTRQLGHYATTLWSWCCFEHLTFTERL